MDSIQAFHAILLGIIEGLTEFLPVSSTGHLILFGDLLGFQTDAGKVFEIVIQLGAILAVCVLYFQKLWNVTVHLPSTGPSGKTARQFALNVILAFLPSAILGVLLHDVIKSVLFSPYVVCISLIIGGIAILLIERFYNAQNHYTDVDHLSPFRCIKIGLFQCLALVPGVSRSGATILGGLFLGLDRKTATEFSFFVAIPTMLGASAFDLYKSRNDLSSDNLLIIAIGFVTAFVVALLTVRWMIRFVQRHNFTPFGWYRIALGIVMLLFFTFAA